MAGKRFAFFESYYVAAMAMDSNEERLQFYDAICRYAFLDEEPQGIPSDSKLFMAFELVRPNIDKSMKIYNVNEKNGSNGGRPRKKKD